MLFCPGDPGHTVTSMTVFAPPRHRREEERQHSEYRQSPEGTSRAPRRRNGERGLVSVEYLATAFIAAALIGVLVAVPVSTQPTVTNGFRDAVCKIFGMGCEGGPEGQGPIAESNGEQHEVTPPTCTVSRSSEKTKYSGSAKFFEIDSGWGLQQEVTSDGKYKLRLSTDYGAGLGVEEGGKAGKAKLEAELRGRLGLELGDAWEFENEAEAKEFAEQLKEYAHYKMLDNVSGDTVGQFFSGLTGGPPPPPEPDSKRRAIDLSGKAALKGNGGFKAGDSFKTKIEGKLSVSENNTYGIETFTDSGDYNIIIESSTKGEANAKGKVETDFSKEQLPHAEAGVEGGGQLGAGERMVLGMNENHDLESVSVRQMKTRGLQGKIYGEGGLPQVGPDGDGKDANGDDLPDYANREISAKGGKVTEDWTTLDVDLTKLSQEDRKKVEMAAFTGRLDNMDLDRLMNEGPSNELEEILYNNTEATDLSQDTYKVDKSESSEGLKVLGVGAERETENSNYELIDSKYAGDKGEDGLRKVETNADCLK